MAVHAQRISSAVLIGLCLARGVGAQSTDSSRGVWGSVLIGYGAAVAGCSTPCERLSRTVSGTAAFRIGGTPRSSRHVGGEVSVWAYEAGGEYLATVSAVALFYVTPAHTLFYTGALGVMDYRRERGGHSEGVGPEVSIGAGYEIPFRAHETITLALVVLCASTGTVRNGSTVVARDWRVATVTASAGVSLN
jgi:hypothetical protein